MSFPSSNLFFCELLTADPISPYVWPEFHAWWDVPIQPGCPGVPPKVSRRVQLGPGLAAVLTAAGIMAVSNVARAGWLHWGGAVALDPTLWALLRLGPLLIVALQVEKV